MGALAGTMSGGGQEEDKSDESGQGREYLSRSCLGAERSEVAAMQ